jgi:hypothetical protein
MPYAIGYCGKNIIIHRFLSQSSAFQANPLIVRHWEGASELLAFFCFASSARHAIFYDCTRVTGTKKARNELSAADEVRASGECDAQHLDWTAL